MKMSDNNLCNSCANIGCEFQSGIVRTKCAFYMPPHIEPDNCGNYAVMQPTVEAITQDQYEARLKADLEAILVELQLEIEECVDGAEGSSQFEQGVTNARVQVVEVIQQKINSLKGDSNDKID